MPARRTSNADKAIAGTLRPDRIRSEPEFPTVDGYPEAPDTLTDEMAIREWNHKAKLLTDAGVLCETDLTTLAVYCNMYSAVMQEFSPRSKPSAADLTQLRLMATEFGFTPASRSKAGGGTGAKDSNPFNQFKDRRTG